MVKYSRRSRRGGIASQSTIRAILLVLLPLASAFAPLLAVPAGRTPVRMAATVLPDGLALSRQTLSADPSSSLSLSTYNVLMPNSIDGWYTPVAVASDTDR